ncbi:MAG TPA: CBS domain-containing protein [Nitrobacter sp.]|nr:CBS domain-containing protein [Nitrobacter sp.]
MQTFLEASAGDYMTRIVQTVKRETTMSELQKLFDEADFNGFPVRENGDIVGLVTKSDFLKCFAVALGRRSPNYGDLLSQRVAEVMTYEFIYVDPETKLTRVLELMVAHQIESIPVLNSEEQLVGVIARKDIMKALMNCEWK